MDWILDNGLSPGWQGHDDLLGNGDLHHPPTYLLTDDGLLTVVSDAKGGGHGGGSGGTGGTGGGTTPLPPPPPPAGTLVGSAGGLQINLLWDNSVLSAANAADIEHSVVAAAQIFTSNFTNAAVLNIHVGLGEVNGSALSNGALGESMTCSIKNIAASRTTSRGRPAD